VLDFRIDTSRYSADVFPGKWKKEGKKERNVDDDVVARAASRFPPLFPQSRRDNRDFRGEAAFLIGAFGKWRNRVGT